MEPQILVELLRGKSGLGLLLTFTQYYTGQRKPIINNNINKTAKFDVCQGLKEMFNFKVSKQLVVRARTVCLYHLDLLGNFRCSARMGAPKKARKRGLVWRPTLREQPARLGALRPTFRRTNQRRFR